MSKIIRKAFSFSSRIADKIRLRNADEYGAHVEYLRIATILFSCKRTKHVADIAAGEKWNFPVEYKERYDLFLTGIDIDQAALDRNAALDERICADVVNAPLPEGHYDLLTAHSGVEHFKDNAEFLRQAYHMLRPGGRLVAQFPSRYAPFAIVNMILPKKFKDTIPKLALPHKIGEIGYPAYYNKCNHNAFIKIALSAGFIIEYRLHSFFSYGYFKSILPLYVLMQAVDVLRFIFLPANFSSYNLYVLRKPGPHEAIKWSWHDLRIDP